MTNQIIATYLAIGAIYVAIRLRKIKQSKFDNMMDELRCVFMDAPDSWHPILSFVTSVLFIFMAAFSVIL